MYNTKYKIYYKVLYVKIKNKTNGNIIDGGGLRERGTKSDPS